MLTFNGKKFARNNDEFVKSLFSPRTCDGYYRRIKGGIQLFNLQRELFAFIVNRSDRESWIVTASMYKGRARYMNAASSLTERYLGIEGFTFAAERNAIRNIVEHSAIC